MHKEIVQQIDDCNKLLSDKFSTIKSTCKAFVAYYKSFANIQQNYSEQLIKLTKTAGKYMGLKKTVLECRENENPDFSKQLQFNQFGILISILGRNYYKDQKEQNEKNIEELESYLASFQPHDTLDKYTMPKIGDLLKIINSNLKGLINNYIPLFTKFLAPFFDLNPEEIQSEFIKSFIEGALAEIIKIINLHIDENIINNDNSIFSFQIAHELSKLDDFMSSLQINNYQSYYLVMTPFLEYWFNNMQSGEGQSLYTKSVIDYCSLLFKSIEILQDLIDVNDQNKFKQYIKKKFEILINESMNDYSKEIKNSLNYLNSINNPIFTKASISKNNQKNNENEVISNLKELKSVCFRFGNLYFLSEQIKNIQENIIKMNINTIQGVKNEFLNIANDISKLTSKLIVSHFWKKNLFSKINTNFEYQQFKELELEIFQKQ
ncbi:hypothetical protein IMG5_005320, partial [Ichthyophthirius multifiliis]